MLKWMFSWLSQNESNSNSSQEESEDLSLATGSSGGKTIPQLLEEVSQKKEESEDTFQFIANLTSKYDYRRHTKRKFYQHLDVDDETYDFIEKCVEDIGAFEKGSLEDNISIGKALAEAREKLSYNQFRDWIKVEFRWEFSTASQYIQLARVFADKQIPELNFTKISLHQLARPTVPPAMREEAFKKAWAGELINLVSMVELEEKYGEHHFNYLDFDEETSQFCREQAEEIRKINNQLVGDQQGSGLIAFELGVKLRQIEVKLGEYLFSYWLENETKLDRLFASKFVRIALVFRNKNSDFLTNFSFKALDALSQLPLQADAVSEALSLAETGSVITYTEVEQIKKLCALNNKPLKILVVDDELLVDYYWLRKLYEKHLKFVGASSENQVEFVGKNEAQNVLESSVWNLVILSIKSSPGDRKLYKLLKNLKDKEEKFILTSNTYSFQDLKPFIECENFLAFFIKNSYDSINFPVLQEIVCKRSDISAVEWEVLEQDWEMRKKFCDSEVFIKKGCSQPTYYYDNQINELIEIKAFGDFYSPIFI